MISDGVQAPYRRNEKGELLDEDKDEGTGWWF
jgi:hypothetical protein